MAQTKKLNVKVGDQVTIISGFHKNETGEVIKVEEVDLSEVSKQEGLFRCTSLPLIRYNE